MKRLFIFLIMTAPLSLFAQNLSYTLKGKIGNLNAPAKVYLGYVNATASFADSTTIKNGRFEFKGTIKYPVQATLIVSYTGAGPRSKSAEPIGLYLESGNITVNSPDSLTHATVTGSQTNADYKNLRYALNASEDKMYALASKYNALPAEKKKDKAFIKDFMKGYIEQQKVILTEQNQIRIEYIKKNPNTMVSLDAIKTIDKYLYEYSVLSPLFDSLSPAIKNTEDGKAYANKLAKMRVMEVGTKALSFTQNDPDGHPVNLSDFQGKYVLVDFWASWCYACRLENPNIVKAYAKYHEKGLEILGVSLDKTKAAWLAAIKKDGLTWKQVSDLKGWKSEVAMMYGIKAIPQNVLLDKRGKIIGKNLKADALEAKLAEIFKH